MIYLDDVVKALRSRGFGVAKTRSSEIVLTRPTAKRRKYDGRPKFAPFGDGVKSKPLSIILSTSTNPTVAAERVVAVSQGKPDPGDPLAEKKANAEIHEAVRDGVQAVLAELGLTQDLIGALQSGRAEIKKKRGRPKKIKVEEPPAAG